MTQPGSPGPRALLASPWAALIALGATWSLLSALLARDGAVARAVWVPIDPARYYAAQAWFVGPWLALVGSGFALLAGRGAQVLRSSGRPDGGGRRGPRVGLVATWRAMVPLWAWCTLLLFVIPDLLVVLTMGREALPKAMRFYGPVAPAAIVVLGSRVLGRLHGLPRRHAAAIVLVSLILQTMLASLLLR